MTDLSPEQIAEIATKAAIAAVQAATGGAQAPSTPEEPAAAEPENSEAADLAAIARQKEETARKEDNIADLVRELLPKIMEPRHLVVFQWAANGNEGRAVREILRAYVAKVQPDYREAQGLGGSSSRNIEALSERIPVHK